MLRGPLGDPGRGLGGCAGARYAFGRLRSGSIPDRSAQSLGSRGVSQSREKAYRQAVRAKARAAEVERARIQSSSFMQKLRRANRHIHDMETLRREFTSWLRSSESPLAMSWRD